MINLLYSFPFVPSVFSIAGTWIREVLRPIVTELTDLRFSVSSVSISLVRFPGCVPQMGSHFVATVLKNRILHAFPCLVSSFLVASQSSSPCLFCAWNKPSAAGCLSWHFMVRIVFTKICRDVFGFFPLKSDKNSRYFTRRCAHMPVCSYVCATPWRAASPLLQNYESLWRCYWNTLWVGGIALRCRATDTAVPARMLSCISSIT